MGLMTDLRHHAMFRQAKLATRSLQAIEQQGRLDAETIRQAAYREGFLAGHRAGWHQGVAAMREIRPS